MIIPIILVIILIFVLLVFYIYCKRESFSNYEHPYIIDVVTGANHSVFLNKYGTLYSCGKNMHGRLGTGNETSLLIPSPLNKKIDVGRVFVGNVSTFLTTPYPDFTPYATGENSEGQLGIGTLDNQYSPTQIPFFKSMKITKIAVGWYHTIFLTWDYEVYVTGNNKYGQLADGTNTNTLVPKKLDLLCRDIAAGQGHSVFLTTDNKVYTAGWNWYGQLGNGTKRNSNVPYLIDIPEPVDFVHAGMSTSLLVTSSGNIYLCGDNTKGQLGLSRDIENQRAFTLFTINDEKFWYVASGQTHTFFLTRNLQVYAVGLNTKGQLGLGHNNTIYKPELIQFFKDKQVYKMAAGATHSVFLTMSGTVYASGDNTMGGQLGVSTITDTNIPVLCDIEIESNPNAQTYKMAVVGVN